MKIKNIFIVIILVWFMQVKGQSLESQKEKVTLEIGGFGRYKTDFLSVFHFSMSVVKKYDWYKAPQAIVFIGNAKINFSTKKISRQFVGLGNQFSFREGKKIQFKFGLGLMYHTYTRTSDYFQLHAVGLYFNQGIHFNFPKFLIGLKNISHYSIGQATYIFLNEFTKGPSYAIHSFAPQINLTLKL